MRRITLTVAVLLATAQGASAATQGGLGDQSGGASQGSSDISVTTTEVAQITDIADVTINPYTGASGIDSANNVCIYTNQAAGHYNVTASGSGASSAFTIANGSDTIAYTVAWNGTAAPGTTDLVTTVASARQTGATNTYPCVTDNANFRVQATHNHIMSVPAGTYTGTLTLLITPDDT